MPAYWQTKEWWESGDPPHYRRGITDLAQAYPEASRSAWMNRRSRAMQFDKLEHWGLDWVQLVRGSHDQTHALDEAPTAVDGIPADVSQGVAADAKIRALTSRLAAVQAKYDATLRESDLEDRIVAKITQYMPALPDVSPPTFSPRNPGRPESVVALFSDYHIGEVVSREETGGLNAYDFDIFMRRLQYHADSIGGICFGKLTGYDFPELVIIGLGDIISGIIHDELVETSDSTLMDWLIDGSWLIAQAFRQLAAEFPSVRIQWHFGNHGRLTAKPRFKRRWVNYDYLLGHMIQTELRDIANITFENQKSFWSLVEVQEHRILALHGDNIRQWAGLPSYGINRAVANLSALLNSQRKVFDTVVLGHFHQTGLLERMDCDIVLNGSAIGGNEYSFGALFAGARPRQVMFGMHPERGRTWQYAIDLTHGDSHECRFSR